MRVALVHVRENYTPAPPMGLLYLGTVLKNHGHTVKVIDSFPAYHKTNINKIRDFRPDVIGLSVLTTGYRISADYTAILKEQNPHALLCWGGVHASALPEEVLRELDLDFVVVGEGEETILEVCRNLDAGKGLGGIKGVIYKHGGEIIHNGPRGFIQDLDTLPVPDRRLLEAPRFDWYLSPPGIIRGSFLKGITTFYTSRGCPFNCIFCCSHNTAGRKFRQRSVSHVLNEIGYLVRDFDVKGLYFNDDTFAIDKEWVFDFCAGLRREKFKLVWGCQTRATVVSDELCRAMKDAGCIQVDIGAESGSEKVLKTLGKGIRPEDTERAFRTARKAGLKTFATFILGTPGETMEDIKKTEELAKRIKTRPSFLILVPYPGSEIYTMARENHWFLNPQLEFSETWANKQSELPVMAVNQSAQELLDIRAKLQNKYFLRNNLEIFLSFFMHPLYLARMLLSLLRRPRLLVSSFIKTIFQQKSALVLEELYQQFNADLMARYMD